MCDYLWIGRACQRRACAGNCSGMGECDNGICICLEGYGDPSKSPSEEDCSSCLNMCSGHGECDQSTRRCLCSPWFTGEDCSFAICPNGCSGRGSCGLDGACICDAGWTSYACDEPACPLEDPQDTSPSVGSTVKLKASPLQLLTWGQACPAQDCAVEPSGLGGASGHGHGGPTTHGSGRTGAPAALALAAAGLPALPRGHCPSGFCWRRRIQRCKYGSPPPSAPLLSVAAR